MVSGRKILFVSLLLTSISAFGFEFDQATRDAYFQRGGNEKALKHLECIMKMTKHQTFEIKKSRILPGRCGKVEAGRRQISVNNTDWAVLIDYTKHSSKRRMFLFNLDGSRPSRVVSFYVSHGRYGRTNRGNRSSAGGKNTIGRLIKTSNRPGSNATSTGLYITGHTYVGKWKGPSGRERSLVVHGIEKGINDNACDRAVVMHGNGFVNERGSGVGVNRMSSGCFMTDYKWVTKIANRIKGSTRKGGAPFFVYGKREAGLDADYYCGDKAKKTVRFD